MTVGTSNVVIFCICLLVVVAVVALIVNKTFFKQLVIKFRGRTEEVVRQDASTPDGARDYFNNAIREKETLYSNAERSYTEIAGKLDEAEKEQYDLRQKKYPIKVNTFCTWEYMIFLLMKKLYTKVLNFSYAGENMIIQKSIVVVIS